MSERAPRQRPAPPPRRAGQWQRWQPASIHEPAPAPPAEAGTDHPAPRPPDAQTLRARLQQAEKAATAAGHKKGYDDGYQKGLKQGRDDGYQKGYQEGEAKGLAAGEEAGSDNVRQAARQLDELLQSTGQALADIESDMGQALVTLAVRIAEKVVHDTIATRPEHLLALVDGIVHTESEHQSPLLVHVHPDDLSLIETHIASDPEKASWRAIPDDSITRGGCRISTPLGDIDATLETRWKRVIATLGES